MSDKSSIEWCDATWNPVTGCTKVSEGCRHCYAATFAERWRGTKGHYFENGFDLTLRPDKLDQPLKWTKPRKIFVNSMSDLFHKDIDDKFIVKVFAIMGLCPQHIFQVLTKRPERMAQLLNDEDFQMHVGWFASQACREYGIARPDNLPDWPYANVWLGTSVENQKAADERIPLLLLTPAAIRFLSCEPLLGTVDLQRWLPKTNREAHEEAAGMGLDPMFFSFNKIDPNAIPKSNLHWIIAGGESGHGARPMHPEWARGLRDQCQTAGVSYFFKQWGEWWPFPDEINEPTIRRNLNPNKRQIRFEDWYFEKNGKKAAGRMLDGREWNEFPEVRS